MSFVILFIRGAIVGLLVSVPLGPIGLITIDNTLRYGMRVGAVSAGAMAAIDITIAAITINGSHHVLPYFHTVPVWMRTVGTLIVCGYGCVLLFEKIKKIPRKKTKLTTPRTFFETAGIIISNPATYLSFGIIALLFGPFLHHSVLVRSILFGGFFIGTAGWWTFLVLAAQTIKARLVRFQMILHKIIGISIILSGISILFVPWHGFAALKYIFTNRY